MLAYSMTPAWQRLLLLLHVGFDLNGRRSPSQPIRYDPESPRSRRPGTAPHRTGCTQRRFRRLPKGSRPRSRPCPWLGLSASATRLAYARRGLVRRASRTAKLPPTVRSVDDHRILTSRVLLQADARSHLSLHSPCKADGWLFSGSTRWNRRTDDRRHFRDRGRVSSRRCPLNTD
jgi:hypothetical protein